MNVLLILSVLFYEVFAGVIESPKNGNELKSETSTSESTRMPRGFTKTKLLDIGTENGTISDTNVRIENNYSLKQGDMILTPEQEEAIFAEETDSKDDEMKKQAYRPNSYPVNIWGSSVYYYYDTTATPEIKYAFERAAQIWSENTCINFYLSETAPNRIRVWKGNDDDCHSNVGLIGGVQEISLGQNCEYVGIALHELAHALGFLHAHARFDRDDFITVNYESVDPALKVNYNKETVDTNFNYGIPYDYGSIMHYGAYKNASSNDILQFIARDANYQETMGSQMLGFYDISLMNEHYNCKNKCPANSPICANGGFNNPKDCQSCVCPSGYGGQLCNERPPGCGNTYLATAEWTRFADSIGDGVEIIKQEFAKCNHWIQAPPGARVEVRISSFNGYVVSGCYLGGVEIKSQEDQKLTGYRACSINFVGKSFISTSNIVPIITFSNYGRTTTTIDIRIYPQ